MKKCNKCLIEKPFDDFFRDMSHKDGLQSRCKVCDFTKKKEKYENIKEINVTVTHKTCNECKIYKEAKEFDKYKAMSDGLVGKCKACRKLKNKKRYDNNKEKIKSKTLNYYRNNKEKFNLARRKYNAKKEKEDILYKLKRRLRNRLYYALKRTFWKKNVHFNDYIGCSLQELKDYIQNKFTSEMTWDNYGIFWQLDHIKPLASAETEEELYKLNHYTNLQPLLIKDHQVKTVNDLNNLKKDKK